MDRHRPYRPAPALQSVLDEINLVGNPLDRMTAENVGALWTLREVLAANVLGPVPVGGVRDVGIPARNRQIPARVYLPPGPELARDGRLPALVYYHGGGWTLGSIATYDSLCRGLARGSGALVVSIDYRLAPEHPFPAAVDDAHLALWWVARNADDLGADVRRLAVGGDSAGGNLASVVAMRAAKEGLPVAFQLQLYPATDLTRTDRPSHEQYGRDHLLTARAIEAFRGFYVPDARDWRRPEVSPLLAADDDFRRLPPAVVMTAGCDPLRDEGEAYAHRLASLGVPVEYRLEPELTHGCLNLFNSALFPDAARRVEPVMGALAASVGRALARG
ncbi:MAG TPA: alpha/beta hydrolase [Gemmataceae bacterium]|nr:alpha/beta hydrolase [Gemmataceae bacterium]